IRRSTSHRCAALHIIGCGARRRPARAVRLDSHASSTSHYRLRMNAGAMSAEERRQPRARFTRALRRICERLDAQDTHEVTWTDRMFPGGLQRAVMRAELRWVSESAARGAPFSVDRYEDLKFV